MSFDTHKNFAYSSVATAPSPASSGTSLVVQTGDGAKFPTVPFNATVWPAGAMPTSSNAEIVRVTLISTDTLTITRTQEGTSARTIVVGDQIANTITNKAIYDIEGGLNGAYDYVISGCVWSGDAYGSTKAASMTSGVIWLNNVQLTVAAVTSRTFTASKDTYVDFSDNGDGTAVVNYTEVANNAASPALTAGRLRNAIIVTGASNIANVGSVNQGQETKVLPIASSVPYAVTDSLGNLINPCDPDRTLLGHRQLTSNITVTSASIADFSTVLTCPVIIPANRKVRVTVGAEYMAGSAAAGNGMNLIILDSTASTEVARQSTTIPGAGYATPIALSKVYTPPSSGARSFKPQGASASGTVTLQGSTSAVYVRVELT